MVLQEKNLLELMFLLVQEALVEVQIVVQEIQDVLQQLTLAVVVEGLDMVQQDKFVQEEQAVQV